MKLTSPVLPDDQRAVFKLALPILFTLLAQLGILASDALFAGRLGSVQLAAASMAAGIWSIGFIAVVGLATQFTTEVARHEAATAGARRNELSNAVVGLVAIGAALLVAVILGVAAPLVRVNIPNPLGSTVADYLSVLAWGAPGACLCVFAKSLHDGLKLPGFGLRAALVSLVINAALNWVLIFGIAQFEGLGLEGCAWATVVTWWVVGLWWASRVVMITGTPRMMLRMPEAMKASLRHGAPVAVSLFAESSFFHVLGLLIAGSRVEIVSAHYLALNVAMLVFSLPLSLSIAASIVGASLVAKADWTAFAALVRRTSAFAIFLTSLLALMLVAVPEAIAGLYSRDPLVVSNAVPLLALVAAFQVADGLLAVAQGAFRSMRATVLPTAVLAIAYWGMGLGLAMTFLRRETWGPAISVWVATVIAISVAASILLLNLRRVLRRESAKPIPAMA